MDFDEGDSDGDGDEMQWPLATWGRLLGPSSPPMVIVIWCSEDIYQPLSLSLEWSPLEHILYRHSVYGDPTYSCGMFDDSPIC